MYKDKYAYVIRQIEEQMAMNFDSYIWFGSEIRKKFCFGQMIIGVMKKKMYLQIFQTFIC
jgi:hypothetical protein